VNSGRRSNSSGFHLGCKVSFGTITTEVALELTGGTFILATFAVNDLSYKQLPSTLPKFRRQRLVASVTASFLALLVSSERQFPCCLANFVQRGRLPFYILRLATANVLVIRAVAKRNPDLRRDADRASALLIHVDLESARSRDGRTKSVTRDTIDEDQPLKPNTSLARLMTVYSQLVPRAHTESLSHPSIPRYNY
jgi:hypothetical protein